MAFETVDWKNLELRTQFLANELANPQLESSKRATMQKEFAHISSLLDAYHQLQDFIALQTDLKQQREANTDPELLVLFDEELQRVNGFINKQTEALEAILFPPDERDNLSVFLEIRAGTGGQEAALFAADLGRMYMMYAQRHNWRASVIDESPTDLGGFKEVILNIQGRGVFGHLKFESGVHRVQRVPSTEASGRIHTSTATVAVLPEVEESEGIELNPADLRIDTYRAGGAGGQHVNKTESAIRITHVPTGIVVTCQDDRSQHKNKAKAMKILRLRLQNLEQEKREVEMSQSRKEQVGTGMRAEKVRTYNFPQNRVTDHQVNVTLNKLDMYMDGDMDDIIIPLREHEREQRRKNVVI